MEKKEKGNKKTKGLSISELDDETLVSRYLSLKREYDSLGAGLFPGRYLYWIYKQEIEKRMLVNKLKKTGE